MYPAELNIAAVGAGAGPLPDSWNMYTDGACNSLFVPVLSHCLLLKIVTLKNIIDF